MGYVEDTGLPMLYREAPLNSIWEGSGNVICLDILRSLDREPGARDAIAADLDAAHGADRRFDRALDDHRARWSAPGEPDARLFAEELATLLTAAILIRTAPSGIADGYITARLQPGRGRIAGSVTGLDTAVILATLAPPGTSL